MALPEVCVCYILRGTSTGDEVLLGRKKRGLGVGKLVGPGGKLEPGEGPLEAVKREVLEEVGLTIHEGVRLVGEISYPFSHHPEWSQKSWVFIARDWIGAPRESDELAPEWFPVRSLPLDQMWDDAKYWLPEALTGQSIVAEFEFGRDASTVSRYEFF